MTSRSSIPPHQPASGDPAERPVSPDRPASGQPAGARLLGTVESTAASLGDLDALPRADPADAPDLADRIASALADRLDTVGREQGVGD
jgi:hypothetical protein